MSHTDSTDDTDLSPLGSVAKHEMLENLRTRIFQITRMSPMGSEAGVSCLNFIYIR